MRVAFRRALGVSPGLPEPFYDRRLVGDQQGAKMIRQRAQATCALRSAPSLQRMLGFGIYWSAPRNVLSVSTLFLPVPAGGVAHPSNAEWLTIEPMMGVAVV
jgi:hypothetical protein